MSIEHLRRIDRVHGVTGNVVGDTDTQTLTNKTLTSPTINNPTISNPTITGLSSLCPSGSMLMYGAASAPTGWLLCDGSAVSRTTFAALFAVVGTTYGVGNGSTTFNLPNMANLFPRGNTPGTGAGADTHTHSFDDGGHGHTSAAHSHNLSDNGQAEIVLTSGAVGNRQVTSAGWSESTRFTGLTTGTSGGRSAGSALTGSTDSTTPGSTGTTHAAGTTGSTSNVPAYTGVAFIIKT